MSIFSKHFPLGLGTTRLPVSGREDAAGFERSVRLVVQALESGVDYIDTGYNYAAGMALPVLREAFRQTARPFAVTAKVMYGEDRTAGDARRRVELYLDRLGLDRAAYFTCWCIWSFRDFEKIMERGGIYDGALRLRDEGVVEHICASLHCPPEEMCRIIESGAFEGVTLSYSLLNAAHAGPVLDAARRCGVGVAVMNPLGGGLIAQNRSYFSFACGAADGGDTVRAALRFAAAHPAVDIVLSGAASPEELAGSLGALSGPDPEGPAARQARVTGQLAELSGFCTGCKYCEGCPKGISPSAVMQARNALLFDPAAGYNREGPQELLYNLQIFRKLFFDHDWLPESAENPCIRCGKCERACTQRLPVMDGVAEIYRRAGEAGYTKAAHRARLEELLRGKGFRRVGLYPNGGFAKEIMRLYRESWGEPEFAWLLFNSDRQQQGLTAEGLTIHAPEEIAALRPEIIVVCTYRFDREISESLRAVEQTGIQVVRLHREAEVPWIF